MIRTFIIAEAGVNHNGSLQLAKKLIECAAEAKADAVKFQTFKTEKVVTKTAPKAVYQLENTGGQESQLDMIKKLELSHEAHELLAAHAKKQGIEFLSAPFDIESAQFLVEKIHLNKLKIPSGEITNAPYLLAVSRFQIPLMVSTGMSTLGEIETALGILAFGFTRPVNEVPNSKTIKLAFASSEGQSALNKKVTLFHCTTEYPAPFEDINLRAMDTLRDVFGLRCGISDHSVGITVPIAAVARGACMVEKHFTLDRKFAGPDHKASLEPQELTDMVRAIREVELALGSNFKTPAPSEMRNREIARKSLVTAAPIKKGASFTEQNLTVKRPGSGISPIYYWDYLGKNAERDFAEDELIK